MKPSDAVNAILCCCCFSACETIGYYTSYWNLPMFLHSCVGNLLANKETFDTVVRVGPSFHKQGAAVAELFMAYGWQSAVVLIW